MRVAEAKHLAELRELLAGAARQSTPNHTREYDIPHPRSGRPGTYRLPPQVAPWREVRQIRVQSWIHRINAKASTCTRKSPGSCGTGAVVFHCDGDPK